MKFPVRSCLGSLAKPSKNPASTRELDVISAKNGKQIGQIGHIGQIGLMFIHFKRFPISQYVQSRVLKSTYT